MHKIGSRLSRRGFLAGTAAAGTLSLAGIRAARAQGFVLPEPITTIKPGSTLRWIDSGDQKAVFYKALFQQYEAERGVKVVYDGLPWSELNSVLPLGIRNGTAQDVFCLPNSLQPAFAVTEGWVRPFDDLIPNFEEWKSSFPDGAFLEGLNMFDGRTYGLPYSSERRSSAHLLYNRKYLNDAGYDPEETPLTWDTFRDAAKKITDNSGGRAFGYIIGGGQILRWGNVVTALAQVAGRESGVESIYTGIDFRTGEVVFDSDEYQGAIELLLAMRDDGSVFPGVMGLNAPQARAFMPQGAAGMILQGPWNVPQWEREAPDFDFGIAPTPAPAGVTQGFIITPSLASISNTMFINAKSEVPEIAADIFHFLGTRDGQQAWSNIVGAADPAVFPDVKATSEMSERSKQVLQMFETLVRVGPNPFARNPELAEVAKNYVEPVPSLAQVVQGLYTGQISGVRESLVKLTSDTNAALDAAFAAASAAGAQVSRDDMVFANWDPSKDYTSADYDAL
jgi:multiple sugar transport system substrate-binding protein